MTASHNALATRSPRLHALTLAKNQVSKQLSRRLPYYLTPDEVHRLIEAADTERDRLLMRVLWETGVRISEAIAVRLADVGRGGIRVLGKGGVERVVFVQEGLVAPILFYDAMIICSRHDAAGISPSKGPIRSSVERPVEPGSRGMSTLISSGTATRSTS